MKDLLATLQRPSFRLLFQPATSSSISVSLGGLILLAIALGAIAAAPISSYGLQLGISTAMWVGVAVAWNIFSGTTRYFIFGAAGFFGIGAYGGILAAPIVGFPIALLAGAALAGIVGLVLGPITLRLRGLQFALATVALSESIRIFALMAVPLTNGPTGITLTTLPDLRFLFAMTALSVVAIVAVWLFVRSSKTGLRLIAIRDDEEALSAAGVSVNRYKILAFAGSVAGMGLFGAVYAFQVGFVDPQSVMFLEISLKILVMVLLGGIGTIWGPVLGAAALAISEEILWARFLFLHEIFLGVILIAVVLFMPDGIVGRIKVWTRAAGRQLI